MTRSVDGDCGDGGVGGMGERKGDEESNALLPSDEKRTAMIGSRRKVRWNDCNGEKLVQVLEFEPSDTSDSEEDEESDSCMCTIM
ncbi:hypothetical protein QJS04_geneDACA002319 [Acorus gramineus]|uniref:Uncharacterized protein n=1 Tax=Acorus gramineus TaxID=55184 RepID=A0AAV9AAJ9_ACOGR|nr:hypothetical protein QJS04_geneDACA002319 [Acorus gramineus]